MSPAGLFYDRYFHPILSDWLPWCDSVNSRYNMEIFKTVPLSGIIKAKRVFKTRHFARWMRKTELRDVALCEAVREMSQGLIDSELGGGLVKKRVGIAGRGKRSGVRTLIATNKSNRWFFVFGYEKNERTTIDADELEALQELGALLLIRSAEEIELALADGALQEICHEH